MICSRKGPEARKHPSFLHLSPSNTLCVFPRLSRLTVIGSGNAGLLSPCSFLAIVFVGNRERALLFSCSPLLFVCDCFELGIGNAGLLFSCSPVFCFYLIGTGNAGLLCFYVFEFKVSKGRKLCNSLVLADRDIFGAQGSYFPGSLLDGEENKF